MASGTPTPFSLRPWPTGDKKPKNLAEFIGRINAEGGFRNVTETQLRDEIKAQDEGRDMQDGGEEDESESGAGESEEVESDKTKPIEQTKIDLIRQIDQAHQSAMQCLDFVSLLLSKENPSVAGASVSPALRDLVGIGTMGASKLDETNITEARKNDDRAVATGWRMMGISRTVDSLVSAAERLEKEISLETKYWAEVLAVSEDGWAVSAMPDAPHTLGVRFGFSEAAAEYRDGSLAPLVRNEDGTVRLACGRLGRGEQRVRTVVERDGKVTGRSRLPNKIPENAPLKDRVLEARNTIFSQELWYELNREARTLLSYGVHADGSTITYEVDPDTKIIIILEDLGDPEVPLESSTDSGTAELVSMALHLYLAYSHRLNYNQRTQAPQQTSNRPLQPYSILRSVIAFFKFRSSYEALVDLLTKITASLHKVGVSTASFTSKMPPMDIETLQQNPQFRHTPRSELLFQASKDPRPCSAEITITPEARIAVRGKSHMYPIVTTEFRISLPGVAAPSSGTPPQPEGQADPNTPPSVLEYAFPPNTEPGAYYPDVSEVIYYIREATIRALCDKFADTLGANNQDVRWVDNAEGTAIVDHLDREARISISEDGTAFTLEGKWLAPDDKTIMTRQWTWALGDDGPGESMESIVGKLFRGELG